MKISALMKQSFKSIWSNKVRSSLTILGVVIGIAAVISLVGLGKGLQSSVSDRLGSLGSTDVTIRSQDPNRQTSERSSGGPGGGMPSGGQGPGRFSFGAGTTATITTDDYDYVKSLENIESASPSESAQVAITKSSSSDTASQYQLYGVDTDYVDIESLKISSGSNLSETQVKNSEKVVLIGSEAATELFDDADPVGKSIFIDDEEYKIIGVVSKEESSSSDELSPQMRGGLNQATSGFITGYKAWLTQTDKTMLSSITAKATSEDVVESVASTIEAKLLSNHGVASDKADVDVSTSQDLLDTIGNVASSFTTTLAGIAAISLVVGGIGIMNIMLVTVTERTREIGLRRALGAKSRHIIYQFLLESLMLTLIGGLLGVAIGVIFGTQLTSLLGSSGTGIAGAAGSSSVIIDVPTILLAVGISSLIGIVFGLFPAIKASKLDPVEALRYE